MCRHRPHWAGKRDSMSHERKGHLMAQRTVSKAAASRIAAEAIGTRIEASAIDRLMKVGLLDSIGGQVDINTLISLIDHYDYCDDWAIFDSPAVHRVSVSERRPSFRLEDGTSELLRTHRGVDFTEVDLDENVRGVCGGWNISGDRLDDAVNCDGVLVAAVKGFIAPGMARRIIGHTRTDRGEAFVFTRSDRALDEIVGSGLVMPIAATTNRWEVWDL